MFYEKVKIPVNPLSSLTAWLAVPSDQRNKPQDGWPGVVVVHEMWGLNTDIKRIIGEFAKQGYVALAPDLYTGGLKSYCVARTVLGSGGGKRPLKQIEKTRQFLADRSDVNADKIGAIGFCLGGGLVLMAGAKGGFKAVSTNYGYVPTKVDKIAGTCPVVASYGAEDKPFVPQFRRLSEFLDDLGVPNDVKLYDGVAHSFLNDVNAPIVKPLISKVLPLGHDAAAAEDAWQRILKFFERHVIGETACA